MDRIALADHAFDKHSGINPGHSVMRLCHVEQDARLRLAGLGVDRDHLAARITLEDGDSLSEDYSFCKRWRSMPGSEIWAVVDEPIGHVGDMVYGAPYLKRLLQGKA